MKDLEILYEDTHIVAVNKPAGLIVHPDGKTIEPTVTDWVLNKFPKTKNVGEPITLSNGEVIARPGIVHRIDRDTSGVLLIAKTQKGFGCLKAQFQGREMKKKYLAFVYGDIKEDEGVINRPIGRSGSDFRKWSAQRGARGELREAITKYKVLSRSKEASYVEVSPETGRTHQIRVHFKAIHHPVVLDGLYAPNHKALLGFSRLALHALSIEFINVLGKEIRVESPLPEDFTTALKLLRN